MFDMSHEIKGSCDIGVLVPIMCKHVVPGDVWSIKREVVMRMNPLVSPTMHEINVYTWDFFVPFRILDEDFEDKFTGGKDGVSPEIGEEDFPAWSGVIGTHNVNNDTYTGLYSLWDYLGFGFAEQTVPGTPYTRVSDYPLRAMNKIFNDYFRDENLEPEIEAPYDVQAVLEADQSDTNHPYTAMGYFGNDSGQGAQIQNQNLFWGSWEKDYFTICLPWQQRGSAPALQLYGSAEINAAIMNAALPTLNMYIPDPQGNRSLRVMNTLVSAGSPNFTTMSAYANFVGSTSLMPWMGDPNLYGGAPAGNSNPAGNIDLTQFAQGLSVNMAKASAGDISDIRDAFQTQKYLERNARIGARYFEILQGRYGSPNLDVRLDRPEYIGGNRTPLLISEVLQTSESDTNSVNQGNQTGSMRGHGISANRQNQGRYRVVEFGIIMTLMCVKPKPNYSQGIDREWLFKSRLDFITPEFVNLSERTVKQQEIYFTGVEGDAEGQDDDDFGFQGQYDEYRSANSKITGLMRTNSFRPWHLGRYFKNVPTLSSEFIRINPDEQKRIYAVTNQHGLLYTVGNICTALRPLPIIAEPGLLDHH
jgi:hypothetical protein